METLLEPFLGFFHCAGEEFHHEDECDDAIMMEVVTPAAALSITSNPSLYSMPSKESMVEVRHDAMQRYGTSPLFSGSTASVPISFEEEDDAHLERRDDSMRSNSSHRRLDEVRQSLSLTPPRKSSVSNSSTATSSISTPRKKSSQSTPQRSILMASSL